MVKKTRIVIVSLFVNLVCLFILILFPSPSRSEYSIVSMGDSITNCSTPTCIYNHCVGVGSYEECYVARLFSLLGISIANLGVGGTLTREGRAWIDGILSTYSPQILTIYYGTNDAHQPEVEVTEVYSNLQYMVRSCKSRGTKPILATIGPQFGIYYEYKLRIDYINQLIRTLAAEESISLADIESALGWNQGYMYDEIHPNTNGHTIVANTFYQAMIRGCTYTIDPASVVYSASGGAGSFAVGVVAGTACPWKAVSNVDWITVTAGTAEIGPGVVDYLVAANKTNQDRTGMITVAGKTFTVYQSGCTYTINPESAVYPASGGEGSIAVGAAGTACPWMAVSNVDWITVTAGSPGIGDGTVYYLVSANKTNQDRTGAVTVAGKTFSVTQKRMVGLPWLQLLLEE